MSITLLLRLQPIKTDNFLYQLLNQGTKKAAITTVAVMPLCLNQSNPQQAEPSKPDHLYQNGIQHLYQQ